MADDDEYDLAAVEVQLARMQQRRSNRLHATQSPAQVAPSLSPSQQHHMSIPAATSEFELNEANLSSHGSDNEDGSNSDCDSNSTNSVPSDDETRGSGTVDPGQRLHRATKRPKARLRDSLDLSMSIAELPKSQKARRNFHKPSAKAADASPSGPKSDQQQQLDTKPTSGPQSGQVSLGKTGQSGRGVGDDAWTSNLVRRRRQLEKDAALTRDQVVDSTAATTVVATQLASQAFVQDASIRGTLPKSSSSTAPPQEVRPTATDNCTNEWATSDRALGIGGSNSVKVLPSSKHPVAASPSQAIKQDSRPSKRHEPPPPVPARALQQRSENPSTATKSHVETKPSRTFAPVAQSYLKPPERYAMKALSVSTPAIALLNTVGTARAHSTTPVNHHAHLGTPVVVPVKSQSTEALVSANVDCSSKSSKAQARVRFACPEEQDEDDGDLLSVEEEKLRQSLEKLDSRLTKLNSDTKQQQQQQHKSDKSVSPDCRTTRVLSSRSKATGRALSTRGSRKDDSSIEIADFVDDDVVAAASYGGGAHCRSGLVTSALERSCYTRRAEMSSGLHKLRIRTGGAMAQESNNSSANLDKDGKHKVVVKKDLAHLLF